MQLDDAARLIDAIARLIGAVPWLINAGTTENRERVLSCLMQQTRGGGDAE